MRARRMALVALLVLVLCMWCGWASGLHHSTVTAFAAWAVSLLSVVAVDLLMWRGRQYRRPAIRLEPVDSPWPRPGRGGAGRTLAGTAPWSVLFLLVVAWEVLGIDTGPHVPHLTISALSQAFRPLNAGVLLVWILVGVGYGAARARAPVRPGPGGPARGRRAGPPAALVGGHPQGAPALLLPANRAAGVAFWVVVVVASVLVDLVARRSHGRLANAEEVLRLISGPRPARVILALAWAYAGWHLFAH